MEFSSVIRDKTFFSNSLIEEYYKGKKLKPFHTYSPDLDGIAEAIKGKSSFSQQKRDNLVRDLYRQYKEAYIDLDNLSLVKNHIDELKNPNTYTITTGQQIHLGLGPIYVLYKIFDVIALTNQLKRKFNDKNFVPVFWMATEDHDLEEIASVSYFGKQTKWNTEQSGAVGRMNTDGVAEMYQFLMDTYQISDAQKDFLQRTAQIYRQSSNLAIAFRKLLHEYLGHTGLIILDADSKELKSSFTSVMVDELKHKNSQALIETSQLLESAGFKNQLRVKSCNLFLLRKNDRIRIDDIKDFTNKTPEDFTMKEYPNLSPNAALRPLYQEWILPNVGVVLGSSELNYWFQLKGLFDTYDMPLPSMMLRTSGILIPSKFREKYFNNNLVDWFNNETTIALSHEQELANIMESQQKNIESIKSSIQVYDKAISDIFKDLNLVNKWSKILDKLYDIEKIIENKWSQKIENSSDLKKVLKLKRAYFNPLQIQERIEFIGSFNDMSLIKSVRISSHFGLYSKNKVLIIFN